jgi:hypothetical protein
VPETSPAVVANGVGGSPGTADGSDHFGASRPTLAVEIRLSNGSLRLFAESLPIMFQLGPPPLSANACAAAASASAATRNPNRRLRGLTLRCRSH